VIVEDGQIVQRATVAGNGAPAAPASPAAAGSDPGALDVASHAAQIADLLAAVEADREPAVSGPSAREALEIVCAIYESSRTGRPVRMDR
jgi:predicted dehydrogenase